MRRSAQRASSSSSRGLTLIELLVTLVILSILAAVPLLGEPLDLVTLGFAAAVVATVVAGKKLSQARPAAASSQRLVHPKETT